MELTAREQTYSPHVVARWEKSKSRSNHENCFANAAKHDKVEFNCAMSASEREMFTQIFHPLFALNHLEWMQISSSHTAAKWIGRHFSRSTIEWFIHLSRAQRVAHGQKKNETRLGWVTLLFFFLPIESMLHAMGLTFKVIFFTAQRINWQVFWAFLQESSARSRSDELAVLL